MGNRTYFCVVNTLFGSYDRVMNLNVDQIDRAPLGGAAKGRLPVAARIGGARGHVTKRLLAAVAALTAKGVLNGSRARINRQALGLDLVVFVMLRTRHHSAEWLATFRRHVLTIPEVVDFTALAATTTIS